MKNEVTCLIVALLLTSTLVAIQKVQPAGASGTTYVRTEDSVESALMLSGTISGVVTESDGWIPIAEASIEALQAGDTIVSSTVTDALGIYSLSLPAGPYKLRTSAFNRATEIEPVVNVVADATTTVNFRLSLGYMCVYDEFMGTSLNANQWDVVLGGWGSVSNATSEPTQFSLVSLSTMDVDTAFVKSKVTAKLPIIFEGRITAYVEQGGRGVYGDGQPRGLRVGSDENNAIEFRSVSGSTFTIEARTVASGIATTTSYVVASDIGRWNWTYRIVADSRAVKFYINDILIATHTTNIPTGLFNIYMCTTWPYGGNVPIAADYLYMALPPVRARATVYIHADGSIYPPTAPVLTSDNITYVLTGDIACSGDGIIVERDNIVLNGAGYRVQGNSSGTGIDLSERSNVTVKNTNVGGFRASGVPSRLSYGVFLYSSFNNTISGNNITDNEYYCIYVKASSGIVISGNNISPSTSAYDGIQLYYTSASNISENNITNSDIGIDLGCSSGSSISENNITNNSCGVLLSGSSKNEILENNVTENEYEGILLSSSSNNTICKNNVSAIGSPYSMFNEAVWLEYNSDYNNISANTLTNSRSGLHVHNSSSNHISGNKITNNTAGIWLRGSSDCNLMTGNNITENHSFGICLGEMILSQGPQRNLISRNHIADNRDGIYLCLYTNHNNVSQNEISANEVGLEIDTPASDNMFFHNNFLGNTKFYISSSSVNVWDRGYPSGGNYWSDYNETDADQDGIGDTPYIINENNTDHYPLMKPYTRLVGDINEDDRVDMKDVGYVSRRFLCVPGDPLWDAAADLNVDEKINMVDIGTVARHFGEHYP